MSTDTQFYVTVQTQSGRVPAPALAEAYDTYLEALACVLDLAKFNGGEDLVHVIANLGTVVEDGKTGIVDRTLATIINEWQRGKLFFSIFQVR